MNSQDTFDVALEIDLKAPDQAMRREEMHLWSQQLAGILTHLMLEDDCD